MQWIITLVTACYIANTVKNFDIQDSFFDIFRRYRDQALSKLCMFPLRPVDGKYFVIDEVNAKPGDIFKNLSLILYETEKGNHVVKIKLLQCALGKWTSRPLEIGKVETGFDVNRHLIFPIVSEAWAVSGTLTLNINGPIETIQTHTEQTTMCSLPPYPPGASYVVRGRPRAGPGDVVRSAHLVYSCASDKRLVGDKDVLCVDNVWSGEVPKCEDPVIHSTQLFGKENNTAQENAEASFIIETTTAMSLKPLSTTVTESNEQVTVVNQGSIGNNTEDGGTALVEDTLTAINVQSSAESVTNKVEQVTVVNRDLIENNTEDGGTALVGDTLTVIRVQSSPESLANKIEQAAATLSPVTKEGNSIKSDEETTSKNASTTMNLAPLGPSLQNNITLQDMKCTKDGHMGVCRAIAECDSVKTELAMNKQPQLCFFQGSQPLVCCVDDVLTLDVPSVATPVPTELQTTTDYMPPEYDYESMDEISSEGCEQIPPHLTSKKTGKKAWDKCIEYQEKYVYACKKGVALGENHIRVNHCGHNTEGIQDTGSKSKTGEFPHMVLLGSQRSDPKDVFDGIRWLCGGSVISEKFVLSTADCAASTYSPVKFVRTSVLRRNDPLDPERIYKIAKVIPHADHNETESYNDIALVETETQMVLDRFVVPACLPVGNSYNDSIAVAIGFGTTTYGGPYSNGLKKVVLTKFSHAECAKEYEPGDDLPKGIIDNLQICYGDKFVPKDTCQGDAGGPLNIHNKDVHCMYTVIGLVSFGIACGLIGVPGVYTRVAAYTPWIESHVWPDSLDIVNINT